LIPWQAGKAVTWDVTVVCPLTDSYIHTEAQDAGADARLLSLLQLAKQPSTLRWKVVTFFIP